MSINTPPSVYFDDIDFNPLFYSIGDEAVTFKFIDMNYLRSTNYAISRGLYTQFYGTIYALGGISGDDSQLTSLNASNITSGTLSVSNGGTGTTTLSSNQILIGDGTSILQSPNLIWNNTSNTLTTSNLSISNNLSINNLLISGNVGIGTTPIEKLDVSGNIKCSGKIIYFNRIYRSSFCWSIWRKWR